MIRNSLFALFLFFIALNCPALAVEFEADVEMLPHNISGKVYVKNNRVNRQEVMGMVTILKNETVLQLFQETKRYVATDTAELEKTDPMAGINDFKTWIKKNKLKKTGTESIQGFKCDLYEGEIRGNEGSEPTPVKIWLSKKLDYPVKYEMFLPPPTGKVTSLLKNVKTGKQPDSLFAVPKGYVKAASVEEAMGMQGLGALMKGAAGNAGSNGQPSGDQANEMAEKIMQMFQQQMQQKQ